MEVSRPTGTYRTIKLIPNYREAGGRFTATRDFRIYNGYKPYINEDQRYPDTHRPRLPRNVEQQVKIASFLPGISME